MVVEHMGSVHIAFFQPLAAYFALHHDRLHIGRTLVGIIIIGGGEILTAAIAGLTTGTLAVMVCKLLIGGKYQAAVTAGIIFLYDIAGAAMGIILIGSGKILAAAVANLAAGTLAVVVAVLGVVIEPELALAALYRLAGGLVGI